MSRRRVYMQDTLDIQQRFFNKLQELIDRKQITGGISGYCDNFGIDRRHFYTQRADLRRGYFEMSWATPLVRYYGVSAQWLLIGVGKEEKGSSTK